MSDIVSLNQHQKKALVIQLYQQGKTRRQIAEVVHMSFKDIANVIKNHTGEDSDSVDILEKIVPYSICLVYHYFSSNNLNIHIGSSAKKFDIF
jgi:hypothetical protein